jgi:hypothetical protein
MRAWYMVFNWDNEWRHLEMGQRHCHERCVHELNSVVSVSAKDVD